jgi:hypothetical protein
MKTISKELLETLLLALKNGEITQEKFEKIITLLNESLI